MGFWCWIGKHDWEVVRQSMPLSMDEKHFAIADVATSFPNTVEQLKGSDRTLSITIGKPSKITTALKLTKPYSKQSSLPVISDKICKICDKTRLSLTERVAEITKRHVEYEAPCVKEKRRKKLEDAANKYLDARVRPHPVEMY